jgi:hypothetical protein
MQKKVILGLAGLFLIFGVSIEVFLVYKKPTTLVEKSTKNNPNEIAVRESPAPTPPANKKTDEPVENIESKKIPVQNELKFMDSNTQNGKTACTGSNNSDFDCWENHYKNLVKTQGLNQAFSDLKIRYEQNSYVKSQCHPLTHILGRVATEIHPKVSDAYKHGNSFCWSGYYHGVMEGVVGKYGRAQFPTELNKICTDIEGKNSYSFDYFNCVHGLGHGVMVYNNTELFDALKLCDNLSGSWEKESCYGGVFMENVIVDNKNHFTKYLNPKEPLYPCNSVDTKYKTQCYLMQTSYMLKISNQNFDKVFSECENADSGFKNICWQSLGRDASGTSNSDTQRTVATCNLGKTEEQISNCVIGAVKDFISYFHSDQQAKLLCNSFTEEIKNICHQTRAEYYKSF